VSVQATIIKVKIYGEWIFQGKNIATARCGAAPMDMETFS
jgi:hypothetical protein